MKTIKSSFLTIGLLAVICGSASAQWVKQTVNTTASFRGLSVFNEKVVWASGTGGTVIRTIDGGATWKVMTVPGAEKLDFRDIEAFDANTAYILSIGKGDSSRIYKTVDGGKTWKLQFKNTNEKAFFDAMACWDKNSCIAMSDPVANRFVLIETKDGGDSWSLIDTSKMPATKDGEAAFAASGTCLMTQGKNTAILVSGGNDARVFKSVDRGHSWWIYETPIIKGTAGSGIFSIAMKDAMNAVIVGGNYEKPDERKDVLALTTDGGKSWKPGTGLTGYRSGVAYIDKKTIVAVGTNGSDMSFDGGIIWTRLDTLNVNPTKLNPTEWKVLKVSYNAVQANGLSAIWAVGSEGTVSRYSHFADMVLGNRPQR